MKEESVYPKEDKVFDFLRRRVFGYIYDEYNPSVLFGIRRIVGRPGRCGCFFYEKRRSLEKEDIFCNEDYRIDFSEDEATG